MIEPLFEVGRRGSKKAFCDFLRWGGKKDFHFLNRKIKRGLKMEKITENEFKEMTDKLEIWDETKCLYELACGVGYTIYTYVAAYDDASEKVKYFLRTEAFFYDGGWQVGGVGVHLIDFDDYFLGVWLGVDAQLKNFEALKRKLELKGARIDEAPLIKDTQTWSVANDKEWRTYGRQKAFVQDMARDWAVLQSYENFYWSDVAWWGDLFTKLGKRYGLMREFRENGIC